MREAPGMAERIDHLAMAVRPERIPGRHQDLGAGVRGALTAASQFSTSRCSITEVPFSFCGDRILSRCGQVGEIVDRENSRIPLIGIGMHQALPSSVGIRRFCGAERLL